MEHYMILAFTIFVVPGATCKSTDWLKKKKKKVASLMSYYCFLFVSFWFWCIWGKHKHIREAVDH